MLAQVVCSLKGKCTSYPMLMRNQKEKLKASLVRFLNDVTCSIHDDDCNGCGRILSWNRTRNSSAFRNLLEAPYCVSFCIRNSFLARANRLFILYFVSNELWCITRLCIRRLFTWLFHVSRIVQENVSSIFRIYGIPASYDISMYSFSHTDRFLPTICRSFTYYTSLCVMCDSNRCVHPPSRV